MSRWVLLAALALQGCATYAGRGVATELATAQAEPGWLLVSGVPRVHQEHDWDCGLAAVNSVIDFWDVAWDGRATRRVLGDVEGPRTINAGQLRDIARAHGLAAFVISGRMDDLVEQLREGRPMIVGLLKPTLGGGKAHYEIVLGVHPVRRLVLTFDPSLGYRQNDIEAFEQEWQPTGWVLLVVVPQPPLARAWSRLCMIG